MMGGGGGGGGGRGGRGRGLRASHINNCTIFINSHKLNPYRAGRIEVLMKRILEYTIIIGTKKIPGILSRRRIFAVCQSRCTPGIIIIMIVTAKKQITAVSQQSCTTVHHSQNADAKRCEHPPPLPPPYRQTKGFQCFKCAAARVESSSKPLRRKASLLCLGPKHEVFRYSIVWGHAKIITTELV